MSATLSIENFGVTNTVESARLAADALVGATQLSFDNSQAIGSNDFLLLGDPGSGGAEIAQVQSVTGQVATLVVATKLKHARFTAVTKLFGNKIKLYAAPNVDGTDPLLATYAAVTGGLADIDPDQTMTPVTDANGSSSFWYRFTYFNSTTSAETDLANSGSARGNAVHYVDVSEVRKAAGMERNIYVSDADILEFRDSAEDEVNGVLVGHYQIPLQLPINGVVVQITKELAVGMLLAEQYPQAPSGSSKNGSERMAAARVELEKIRTSKTKLLNQIGIDKSKSGVGNLIGTGPDTDPMFTVAGKF